MAESAEQKVQQPRTERFILAWLVPKAIVVLIVLTFLWESLNFIPTTVAFCGWGWVIGAAAFTMGGIAVTLVALYLDRTRKRRSIFWALAITISGFLVAIFSPFVLATILFGFEAGHGVGAASMNAILLVFLCGLVALQRAGAQQRQLAAADAADEAMFDSGPIGTWRAKLPPTDHEMGFQIVFRADGSGFYRRWNPPADEAEAVTVRFQWRLCGRRQFKVAIDDASETWETLTYFFLRWGGECRSTRLILRKNETHECAEEDLPSPSDYWPEFFTLAYVDSPT